MDLTPPSCSGPECEVILRTRRAMARRANRTVAYTAHLWRCERCADPDTGEQPLDFIDAALAAVNDEALAIAWRRKYGTEIPPSGRPGRPAEAPRTARISVLLTTEELERIDRARGERSRSAFLREVVLCGLDPRAA